MRLLYGEGVSVFPDTGQDSRSEVEGDAVVPASAKLL